jgi:hypothetical protein
MITIFGIFDQYSVKKIGDLLENLFYEHFYAIIHSWMNSIEWQLKKNNRCPAKKWYRPCLLKRYWRNGL